MPFHAFGVRVRGLLAASLCYFIPFAAQAQWWDPPRPGRWMGSGTLGQPAQPAQPAQPVVYTRQHLEKARTISSAAIVNGEFAKIERMHAEFVRDKVRTTDGIWLAQAVQEGIDGTLYASDTNVEGYLRNWEQAVPDSKLLPVVKAMRWQRAAWRARGGGSSAATPEEAQQLFREGLAKAAKALKDSEVVGKETPLWYWTALIVAGSSGASTESFDALFDEAVTRFPTYHTLYYTRVNYLLPQWGGNFKRVDAFVQQSVQRTSASEGSAFYAWIYIDVLQKINGDYLEVTAATWPKMKQSFEDLVSRYPDPWNRNLYATFACRARDRETTARLLGTLGKDAQLGAWSPGISTEGCTRFAFDKV
ncbi:hypothetical protein [Usitatibacter rugosus]|nr:hypothetical protein [Usitatibacter rugosus]